jgi:hypothetical protein
MQPPTHPTSTMTSLYHVSSSRHSTHLGRHITTLQPSGQMALHERESSATPSSTFSGSTLSAQLGARLHAQPPRSQLCLPGCLHPRPRRATFRAVTILTTPPLPSWAHLVGLCCTVVCHPAQDHAPQTKPLGESSSALRRPIPTGHHGTVSLASPSSVLPEVVQSRMVVKDAGRPAALPMPGQHPYSRQRTCTSWSCERRASLLCIRATR